MQYRKFGRTGLRVSTICLGTMQFGWTTDEKNAHAVMDRAVELGCNFFDTADVYSRWADGNPGGISEQMIGSWLAKRPSVRRNLIIATKVRGRMSEDINDQGLSRHHIMHAVDGSLRRLGTDYIDLFQVHSPDELTSLDETLRALDDLVRAGKVRYIGCSNYPAWLLMKSLWVSEVSNISRFESVQPHYNYVHRAEFERELQPLCLDQEIAVIPYSPLAAGFLTGKYRRDEPLPASERANRIRQRYMNAQGFSAVESLAAIGSAHNATVAQTAVAWVLANPAVTSAIIGANDTDQLDETLAGTEIQLDPEEKRALDKITDWRV